MIKKIFRFQLLFSKEGLCDSLLATRKGIFWHWIEHLHKITCSLSRAWKLFYFLFYQIMLKFPQRTDKGAKFTCFHLPFTPLCCENEAFKKLQRKRITLKMMRNLKRTRFHQERIHLKTLRIPTNRRLCFENGISNTVLLGQCECLSYSQRIHLKTEKCERAAFYQQKRIERRVEQFERRLSHPS